MKTIAILIAALCIPSIMFAQSRKIESDKIYSLLAPYKYNDGRLTVLFVGKAKQIYGAAFRERLSRHVDIVSKHFRPKGLVSYTIYSSDDYEVAVMQWPSEEVMNNAFAGEAGAIVQKDGAEFLETKIWRSLDSEPGQINQSYFHEVLKEVSGSSHLELSCQTADPDVSISLNCGDNECLFVITSLPPDVPGGPISQDTTYRTFNAQGPISSTELALKTSEGVEILGKRTERGFELRSKLFPSAICR